MGQHHSIRRSVVNVSDMPVQRKEEDNSHLGTVNVKLSWLVANNRLPEHESDIVVTGKSTIFHGTSVPLPCVMEGLTGVNISPKEVSLMDSRATQLLVTYCNGWHAITSPEVFSRHSGTCMIIGDRTSADRSHPIKIGDCFRFGSVGVVVTEIKIGKGQEQRLDTKKLQYLREEALAFDVDQDEAVLAQDEDDLMKRVRSQYSSCDLSNEAPEATSRGEGINTSQYFCYMCYETHDTPEDHLVAPCECKGDTRFLHVQCLQKWYQSSVVGTRAFVIRTTGNGAPACKICGAAYKTAFRNNGVRTSLLEVEHPGPYISLVVVTKHDTSPGLFNTKFRLNFGPQPGVVDGVGQELSPSELTIGRSNTCNMVLDYRTVSTVHAKIYFRNNEFFLQDSRSSNGTMVYVQGPLPLPNNQIVRLRMGRSTLSIQAKRPWTASMKAMMKRKANQLNSHVSLEQLQKIMSSSPIQQMRQSLGGVSNNGSNMVYGAVSSAVNMGAGRVDNRSPRGNSMDLSNNGDTPLFMVPRSQSIGGRIMQDTLDDPLVIGNQQNTTPRRTNNNRTPSDQVSKNAFDMLMRNDSEHKVHVDNRDESGLSEDGASASDNYPSADSKKTRKRNPTFMEDAITESGVERSNTENNEDVMGGETSNKFEQPSPRIAHSSTKSSVALSSKNEGVVLHKQAVASTLSRDLVSNILMPYQHQFTPAAAAQVLTTIEYTSEEKSGSP